MLTPRLAVQQQSRGERKTMDGWYIATMHKEMGSEVSRRRRRRRRGRRRRREGRKDTP
jgi:hypothetical protein